MLCVAGAHRTAPLGKLATLKQWKKSVLDLTNPGRLHSSAEGWVYLRSRSFISKFNLEAQSATPLPGQAWLAVLEGSRIVATVSLYRLLLDSRFLSRLSWALAEPGSRRWWISLCVHLFPLRI